MRSKAIALLTLLFYFFVFSFEILSTGNVKAATLVPNNIIDDSLFNNVASMSAQQIDAFLNSFSTSCISPNSGFKALDPIGYSPSSGFVYGAHVTAGQVIYDAAQAYGLNPQVILATLEKEQGLITGRDDFNGYCNNGDQHKYAAAMGYGCPDSITLHDYTGLDLYQRNGITVTSVTSTCVNSSARAGFTQQVIRGTWLFRFGEQRSEGNISWAVIKPNWDNSDDLPVCYSGPMTQGTWARGPSSCGPSTFYDGFTVIDNTSIHLDNGATAALYWYTPHFHGNQLFLDIFTGWFGDTHFLGQVPSSQSVYAKSACTVPNFDPSFVGRLYQPDAGDYIFTTSVAESCSAVKLGYIWDGIVMESATGPNTIPVYRLATFSRHFFTADTNLRASYLSSGGWSDEGIAFYAYAATQSGSLPVYQLSNGQTSFFTSGGAEGNYYVQSLGYTSTGILFYTPNLNQPQKVVYRLKGSASNERFYTTDSQELAQALSHNYISEGNISMDDTMPDAHNLPVYRLYSPKAGHFYTTVPSERNTAVINGGYLSEGTGWYAPDTTFPNATVIYRQTNFFTGLKLYTSSYIERNDARTYYGYTDEGAGWYGY